MGVSSFELVGEGTLVTADGNQYYSVKQFKNVGETVPEVIETISKAALEQGEKCVGFHVNIEEGNGRYLECALLFDASLLEEWPVPTPSELSHAQVSWEEGGLILTEAHKTELWRGSGPCSVENASASIGKGWDKWQAYRKRA